MHILCVVCILACSSIRGARGVHGAHGIIKARWTLFPPPAPQSVRRGRIQEQRNPIQFVCKLHSAPSLLRPDVRIVRENPLALRTGGVRPATTEREPFRLRPHLSKEERRLSRPCQYRSGRSGGGRPAGPSVSPWYRNLCLLFEAFPDSRSIDGDRWKCTSSKVLSASVLLAALLHSARHASNNWKGWDFFLQVCVLLLR